MHLNEPKGLSLVELLVTTTIVGMIMLGMVSIDYALRVSEQQQTRAALVSLKTSAMMVDIANTAGQAIGDAATQCIQIGNITTDNTNYICIYRSATPTDASDDEWTCYTRQGTDLHKCTFDAADGPADCSDVARTSDRVIGTVTTDVFSGADTPVVVNDRVNKDFYFQFTLKSRYDSAAATYAAVVAQEYLTNPKMKMTSRVTPGACVP